MHANIDGIYPLSPLQQGLLFHSVSQPQSTEYFIQVRLEFRGNLNLRAFEAAWADVLERHTILRTAFAWEGLDNPLQVVQRQVPLPLTIEDWRHRDEADVETLLQQDAGEGFDLEQAPLMRWRLLQMDDRRWQLLWSYHHLLLDGWSVGLLMADWLNRYRHHDGDAVPALPAPAPFGDYIAWLDRQDSAQAEQFWRAQLDGFASPTPLPRLDPALAPISGLPYAEQTVTIDGDLWQALRRFCQDRGFTVNTLLQGAWGVLLGSLAGRRLAGRRLAGRREALFGVTVSGRPDDLAGVDAMVGLFINTLPLRLQWDEETSLADWLARLHALNGELHHYEHTPLVRLKALSRIPGDAALFETIFVFENFPFDGDQATPGDRLTLLPLEEGRVVDGIRQTRGRNNYPLSLIASVENDRLQLLLSYRRRRFSDATAALLLGHLQQLLHAFVTQSDRAITDLDWLGPEDRQKQRQWGQGTEWPLPACSVADWFADQVKAHPDRAAVADRERCLTYAELDAAANRLARDYRDLGLQSGDIVALALPRKVDFVVAVIAALKAGLIYVPLDSSHPALRQAAIVEDSGARVVLTTAALGEALASQAIELVELDGRRDRIATLSDAPLAPVPAGATAYLVYTSGSTGAPKGVAVSQRALLAYTLGILRELSLPAGCRFASVSTLAADLGYTQMFGALLGGGCLYLVDDDTRFDPAALAATLEQQRIDVLKLTPSHLHGLLAARPDPRLLPRHTLLLGGEILETSLLRQVRALSPDLAVYNHYGPSEATVGAVLHRVDLDAACLPDAPSQVPLGRPQPNRLVRVLDPQGRELPTGVPGELCLGGEGLADGYHRRPALTETHFFTVFNLPDDSGRLYRTGDRVRWLANGELMFLGRLDNQVKVRGYRVEPDEVAFHLKRLSERIRQAVVHLWQDGVQAPKLVAYLVAEGDLNIRKLQYDLSLHLPEYMVPGDFVLLDRIPVTGNGKVDYRRLPAPPSGGAPGAEHQPPRSATETALAEVWRAVLQCDVVGVNDHFFALGGDSIMLLQVIARARQQGMALTPALAFEHRTIAALAAVIDGAFSDTPETTATDGDRPALPLSPGQHHRLANPPLQASWRLLRSHRPLDRQMLATALEALRQHYYPFTGAIPLIETTDAEMADPASLASRLFDAMQAPADHAGEPWLAAAITDTQLLLCAHPLGLDGAGWPLLLRELALACGQAESPPAFSSSNQQLQRYLEAQQRRAQSDEIEPAWEYWLEHAGLELPALNPEEAPLENSPLPLTAATQAAVSILLERHAATPLTLVTAALASLLCARLRSDTVAVAVSGGRPALAELPPTAPLSRIGVDPSSLLGALDFPVPVILQGLCADPLSDWRQVQRQLSGLPQAGSDYGLLRYLSDNAYLQEPLLTLPRPQAWIRWLGDWDGDTALGTVVRHHEPAPGEFPLVVSVYRQGGVLQAEVSAGQDWARHLAETLTALVVSIGLDAPPRAEAFPLCPDRKALAELPLDWQQVEDLYPLTPMQHGMMIHSLRSSEAAYLSQTRLQWDGPLDRDALEHAWGQLVARHPILRTTFVWRHAEQPLQCVHRRIDRHFFWEDLGDLPADRQQHYVDRLLAQERAEPRPLEQPPLTWLRVMRLSERRFVLCHSIHHALSDAWTFGLLMDELLQRYSAYLEKRTPVLAPALPFHHYLRWLGNQDPAAAREFWQRTLAGFDAPTPLPFTGLEQEPPVESPRRRLALGVADTQQLQRFCQQQQITVNTLVQGAWALLLARCNDCDDVTFGISVAGRPADLEGADSMRGVFIQTLPLRVAVDDRMALRDWLHALLNHNLELRRYEHLPLTEIQRCSDVDATLFESVLVFANAPLDDALTTHLPGCRIDFIDDWVQTNYPLLIDVLPGSKLELQLTFDPARFHGSAADRTLFHLRALIQAMIAQPDARLGELDLLTAPERQQLDDFNRTENAFADWGYPLKSSYPELFARQVRRSPDKTAAVCRGLTLDYRELDRRSNRLAHALTAGGACPERLVALLAERDLPLLGAMIATFKTGAAYLPLDPNLPQARLQQLLDLSEAPVLAASLRCWEQAAALTAQQATGRSTTLCMIEEHWLEGDDTPLPLQATPENLAYVIFTSGSTGAPKGAMVEQRGMLNNMFGNLLSLGLSADDRVAQTASQAFDISVWQFLAAPLVGATVHVLPDEVTRNPAALLRAVDEQGITLMELVPAQIRALLGAADAATSLRSLRWLQSIGEALPAVLVRDWLTRFPAVPLLNAYGPAECSDNVAYCPITEIPADLHRPIPIGRPTANNQLYILDSARRRQPVGVPGEICAAGVSVGRGYWRDPGQTAEVFVEHPFAPGQRFYRTGDVGRWREDGTIEYLGRRDFQCKLRGQRVEPGEIEAHLELLDAIDTAAVVAITPEEGSQHLVAYWSGPADVPGAVLRRALTERLPGHMVPSLFVRLDTLPQNRNGKVDRKALAQRPVRFARHGGQEPRTATERQLAAIWKELLPAAAFGIDDNFFSLGGHSLLATQVLSRIRRHLGVELPLRTLFERSTIAALAEAVDTGQRAGGDTAAFDIPRVSRDKPLPLSYAQQRLWFLDQLEGASGAYNIPAVVRLRGALNTEALKAAVDTLLQRHESLRTCFRVEGDSPRQIIVENCRAEIAFHDLSPQSAQEQQQTVQRLIDEEAERPFDLVTAPMLRVALQRLSENTHVLQFTLHHIAADAWSLGILMREFIHCYQAFAANTAPALPSLPIQYGDYAHWQRSERQREQLARDLDYWRRQLQGVPAVIKLPLDGERPSQPDYRGAALTHTLPAAQVQVLKTYGQSHRATLFMVLLNAFNSLLQRAAGENDFLVGTDVANREHPALEGLIGFFVNVLPLRTRLNDTGSFTERLETLRDTTLEAYQHQRVPYDKLVEALQPPRQPGVNPLVQVLFVMQNTPKADIGLEELEVEELSPQHETSKFDLAVFLEENEKGEITARWLYRTSLFHPGTVENLKRGFQSLLEQVAFNPALALTQWQWSLTPSEPKASRKNAKLSKLKGARPILVSHAPQEQVETSTLASGLPLIVEPRLAELDPLRWAQQSRQWIETQLQRHGGLLFRGFNLPDAAAFEQFAQAIEPSLYGNYGDLPKNTSGNNIYHSTPYPEQQMILYHNESSHMAQWPRKQWFYCEMPARRGGCTPIVDCREVYRRLPSEILAPFEQKGLRYVRHFTDRLDVKWQDFFKTEDRRQVEAQCRQQGIRWEWLDNDGLRIEQHGPAVITHPDTSEKSFFNQVQLHHESCLEPEVRSNLHNLFGPDKLPRNVYYGDGSTIKDAVMEEIGRIYEACAVRFDWQKRDVVMLDNMLVAHARDPFEGKRRICVAMAQMYRRQDTAQR